MIIPLLFFVAVTIFSPTKENKKQLNINNTRVDLVKISPPALQVYHAINKYAPKDSIPYKIAFGVAKLETGYYGPLDLSYNYAQTSVTGAEGGMQFIPSTARWVADDPSLTREQIRYDIDLNVKLSMRYLRILKDRYNKWPIVLGYYNTGYPKINSYARKIMRI